MAELVNVERNSIDSITLRLTAEEAGLLLALVGKEAGSVAICANLFSLLYAEKPNLPQYDIHDIICYADGTLNAFKVRRRY